jgi:carboxyl-terminal processing protease
MSNTKFFSTKSSTVLAGAVMFCAMLMFSGTAIGEEEKFGGVGLKVETKGGELVVLDVLAGTDAQAQGIQRGDVIIKIDKANTHGVEFAALIGKLRGTIGSEVILEVKRAGTQKLLTFKVKRAEIVYPG